MCNIVLDKLRYIINKYDIDAADYLSKLSIECHKIHLITDTTDKWSFQALKSLLDVFFDRYKSTITLRNIITVIHSRNCDCYDLRWCNIWYVVNNTITKELLSNSTQDDIIIILEFILKHNSFESLTNLMLQFIDNSSPLHSQEYRDSLRISKTEISVSLFDEDI